MRAHFYVRIFFLANLLCIWCQYPASWFKVWYLNFVAYIQISLIWIHFELKFYYSYTSSWNMVRMSNTFIVYNMCSLQVPVYFILMFWHCFTLMTNAPASCDILEAGKKLNVTPCLYWISVLIRLASFPILRQDFIIFVCASSNVK